MVEALVPGGPADKAGVKLYDVLMKADGEKSDGRRRLVARHDGGQGAEAHLDLIRGGKPQTVTVALGERRKVGPPERIAERRRGDGEAVGEDAARGGRRAGAVPLLPARP